MDWLKGLNEVGKGLINLAIAIIVFAIVQPIVKKEIDFSISLTSAVVAIVILFLGFIFSSLKPKEEKNNEP